VQSFVHPRLKQRLNILRSAVRSISSIERNQLNSEITLDYVIKRLAVAEDKIEAVGHGSQELMYQLIRAVADARADLTGTITKASEREIGVLRAIYENAPGNRQRLWEIRSSDSYNQAYTEDNPLVSVCIPTYNNIDLLVERSLPSVLNQTYQNIEIIIVGDGSPPEVEDAIRQFSDDRVHYTNLLVRGPYPTDPHEFWLVAGAEAQREATRLSRGRWVAHNCDDDAFTPDHIEVLLGEARERKLEIAYGKMRRFDPNGTYTILGEFPPAYATLGWQSSLIHGAFKAFPSEPLVAFGLPGDMIWVERMLALGVRYGMVDKIVTDYYPSLLWGTPSRPLPPTNDAGVSNNAGHSSRQR
jgi:Glycosyl transferase family 2